MTKQVKLSWDTIHTAVESLAYQLSPMKLLGVVGIARGGLIPATMLSHKLGNIAFRTIRASSYGTDNQRCDVKLEVPGEVKFAVNANPAHWVFVDDVLDSGFTYDAVKAQFPIFCSYAVIVTKRPLLHGVASFCQVPHDVWVKFPWED